MLPRKLFEFTLINWTFPSVRIHFQIILNFIFKITFLIFLASQFVIFNPWKDPWNWIAFYQNSFVISSGLLYHLIRRDSGRLANEDVTSNPIVSSKQWLNGLKITNWSLEHTCHAIKIPQKYNCWLTKSQGKHS